jgi:serine/threonine-protein kinase
MAQDLALGLGALHAAGIVHRDLKPANVIILPSGATQLVDLGIAHHLSAAGTRSPG